MTVYELWSHPRSGDTYAFRLEDGRVVKDPDVQIQRTVVLVFTRFAELGSCQKVLRRFRDDGLRLPRRQTSGPAAGTILWKPPTEAAIYAIVQNPAYAGAFVYGRHRRHPDSRPGQHAPRRHCAMDDWRAIHQDAYPASIGWEEFMTNQARLTDNASRYVQRTRGAAGGNCTSSTRPTTTTSARPWAKSTGRRSACTWMGRASTPSSSTPS